MSDPKGNGKTTGSLLTDAQIKAIGQQAGTQAGNATAGAVKQAVSSGAKGGAQAAAQQILSDPTGSANSPKDGTTVDVATTPASVLASLQSILAVVTNPNAQRMFIARSLLITVGIVGIILGLVIIAATSDTGKAVAASGKKVAGAAATVAAVVPK